MKMQQSIMAAMNEDRKHADEEHKRTMAAYKSRGPITQRAVAENEAERIEGYRAGIDRPVEVLSVTEAYLAYIAAVTARAIQAEDSHSKFTAARSWFLHGSTYKNTGGMLRALQKRYSGDVGVEFTHDKRRVLVLNGEGRTLASYDVSYAPDGSVANVMMR